MAMSSDFLAKRIFFFVSLQYKVRPNQNSGSLCLINLRIKNRRLELFPWHCHLLPVFIRLKYIGFDEQDAKFAHFPQIFIAAKWLLLGWLKKYSCYLSDHNKTNWWWECISPTLTGDRKLWMIWHKLLEYSDSSLRLFFYIFSFPEAKEF